MENMVNKILSDREKKDNVIKSYSDSYQVVCLKANIPGINKNIKEAYVIISVFDGSHSVSALGFISNVRYEKLSNLR